MKLIVGLGNPENEYDYTRHNVGFMSLNEYSKNIPEKWKYKKNYYYLEFIKNNEKIILLKPDTFMNNSGKAINDVFSFYNLEKEDILIIFDDLDLNFGQIKIKHNSSAGGHNGMKSIISHLGTKEILRIKIGICTPRKKDGKSFVLSKFNNLEKKELTESIFLETTNIIDDFINGSSNTELMNKYN